MKKSVIMLLVALLTFSCSVKEATINTVHTLSVASSYAYLKENYSFAKKTVLSLCETVNEEGGITEQDCLDIEHNLAMLDRINESMGNLNEANKRGALATVLSIDEIRHNYTTAKIAWVNIREIVKDRIPQDKLFLLSRFDREGQILSRSLEELMNQVNPDHQAILDTTLNILSLASKTALLL